MGVISERTRDWVRRLRGRPAKHEEARQLRPVALAGASRRSDAASQLCNTFAASVCYAPSASRSVDGGVPAFIGNRRKAVSDGEGTFVEWTQCEMCERDFVACVSRYANYCSHDCKSASLIVPAL